MENALNLLLTHLPLLRPGISNVRREYLRIIPRLILHSMEKGKYLPKCRQLLSLATVHPAFLKDERNCLSCWLDKLDKTSAENTNLQLVHGKYYMLLAISLKMLTPNM